MKRKCKDHTGEIFGKLTAERLVGIGEQRHARWRCRCECGVFIVVLGKYLRSGAVQSCGCAFQDKRKKRIFNQDMDNVIRAYYIKTGAKGVKAAIKSLCGKEVTVDQIYNRAKFIGVRQSAPTLSVKDKAKAKPKIGRPLGAVVETEENPLWLASAGPLVPLLCQSWREGVSPVLSTETALYADREAVRRTREYYRKNSKLADKPIWERMKWKGASYPRVSTEAQPIAL